jgi:CcmD family protein
MSAWISLLPTALVVSEPAAETASLATARPSEVSGGPAWVVAVNLVIWSGLFLYLLRLERRLDQANDAEKERSR